MSALPVEADSLLPPAAAALHLGIGLKGLRRLGLPSEGTPTRRLYRASVLDSWRAENGTATERRSAQAQAQFTKHRRYQCPDGTTGPVSSHPLYEVWRGMCRRTGSDDPNYGGRGIRLHEPWRDDPAAFIEWAAENLGPRGPGQSLDRIAVDGHYVPGNLKWSSATEQNQNRRNTRAYRLLAGEATDWDCLCPPGLCPVSATATRGPSFGTSPPSSSRVSSECPEGDSSWFLPRDSVSAG